MATYDYIDATGVIIPDTETIQQDVFAEWRAIFGDDFYVTPDTPEGVMVAGEVTSRISAARIAASQANQVNPNYSGGIYLDAIWALTGGARRPAEHSTVTATLAGVSGTIIPAGSLAATAAGDNFELIGSVIIGGGGTITGEFRSVVAGPIPIAINTLTQVVSGILGWETVDNAAAGTVGRTVESDQASRLRRRQTLALQGRSTAEAIISNVMDVEGVRSMTFLENTAATTQSIQGISMVRNSIWACVLGGTNLDVATALREGKSAGAGYNGAVSVNVTDPVSGQTQAVLFARPTNVAVLARITVRANSAVADPASAIDAAILAYANGESDGESGFVVGGDVSPFELGGAVNRAVPGLFVTLVEVSYVAGGPSWITTTLTIDIDEVATINAASITTVII